MCFPDRRLLDQMVAPFFPFWGTSIMFAIVAVPVYITTNNVQGPLFSTPHQHFSLVFWTTNILSLVGLTQIMLWLPDICYMISERRFRLNNYSCTLTVFQALSCVSFTCINLHKQVFTRLPYGNHQEKGLWHILLNLSNKWSLTWYHSKIWGRYRGHLQGSGILQLGLRKKEWILTPDASVTVKAKIPSDLSSLIRAISDFFACPAFSHFPWVWSSHMNTSLHAEGCSYNCLNFSSVILTQEIGFIC